MITRRDVLVGSVAVPLAATIKVLDSDPDERLFWGGPMDGRLESVRASKYSLLTAGESTAYAWHEYRYVGGRIMLYAGSIPCA